MQSPLLDSLRRAIEAAPDDVPLRLHLAELLLTSGEFDQAVAAAAAALQRDPANQDGARIMTAALSRGSMPAGTAPPPTPKDGAAADTDAGEVSATPAETQDFDWRAAEHEVRDLAQPMYVDDSGAPEPTASAFEVERSTINLSDVGGMTTVKERLNAAFLAPLRNPELRRLYSKSLRGGLLLYGPPGCGKTFIARAVAGELGASFISLGIADILDPLIGNSERNIHEAFQLARRRAPCVLFLDEVDSLGQRRSQTRNNAMRNIVNQLLIEFDGADASNEGVFVLAATNQPWDVDPAFRRPGRLDRTLLVLPPDGAAREAIFRFHLRDRPVEGIDLKRLAKDSDGLSGADISHACELASERALLESARTGTARLIGMQDLTAALRDVQPSITAWLDSARNVVLFGDDDGTYKELRAYLRKAKRL